MRFKNFYIVIVIFLALIILYFSAVYCFFPDANKKTLFADYFAPLNTIFSGLALGGVVYALLLQQKQLTLQIEDFNHSKKQNLLSQKSSLILEQLGRCDKRKDIFTFSDADKNSKEGIYALKALEENLFKATQRGEMGTILINKKEFNNIILLLAQNKRSIITLTDEVYQSSRIVKMIASDEMFSRDEIMNLEMLFYLNIGLELNSIFAISQIFLNEFFAKEYLVEIMSYKINSEYKELLQNKADIEMLSNILIRITEILKKTGSDHEYWKKLRQIREDNDK